MPFKLLIAALIGAVLTKGYVLNAKVTTAPQKDGMPSFDCNKANGQNEVLICSNPKLAAMDAGIAMLYRTAVAVNPSIRAEQRKWVLRREGCTEIECLLDAHEGRLEALLFQNKAVLTFKAPNVTGTLKIINIFTDVYGFAAKAYWGRGDNVHDGSSVGVVHLVNGQGKSTDSVGCDVTLTKIKSGSWSVVQGDSCQQGVNVTLTGVYHPFNPSGR